MENKTLNKLLKQLPKKYHDRVIDFTEEDGFIDNNINKSIEEIMNDYNILVNKDYNDKSILYLSYNDVNHMDYSCKKIILKIRGYNAFI